MNHRLTAAAAAAVILASVSEFSLISGAAWLVDVAGAVVVVALAGTLARQSPVQAGAGATALAGLASVPLLVAHSPYLKATGVVVVAACAASMSGVRWLRVVAGLATYLAALLLYLNVLLAAGRSFLAVVPTPASVHHLATLVSAGLSAANGPPPVAGHHGVLLLAAGSIGLVAVVVDFLAVRLHRPAIAGLPLLVVYMAPIAFPAKVGGVDGAITFLLAAAGYLALLSSDGRYRLRGWGRVVTVWHYAGEDERLGGADMGVLAATGRRIGLAAVCAALIAPLLLPGLTLHQIFGGHSGNGGGSRVPVGLPNPVAQLHGLLTRSSPERVLTYRTTADNADNYLQVYVLNYDARAGDWDLTRPTSGAVVGTEALLPAPGLADSTPRTQVRTTITVPRLIGYSWPIHFLPAPYWPMRINVPGTWHESVGTLMVYSGDTIGSSLRYTVTSGDVEPTPAMVAAAQRVPPPIAASYLGFRSPVTPRLIKIARQVTKGEKTAFGRAVALERWFLSSRFRYSLQSTVPNSPRGLLAFLTTSRQGYCQQFAFAMAVLARLLGIPSRVAVGYTAGQQRPDETWVVTTADAHAWPELYFTGVGWLRFEPTPGGVGGQDTAVEPSYVSATGSDGGGTKTPLGGGGAQASHRSSPTANLTPHVRIPTTGGDALTAGPRRSGIAAPIGLAVLALLVIAAVAPGATRIVSRRRRWRAANGDAALAKAAWQELCADLEDYGMRCRESESPRALARRICSVSGIDAPACLAIGRIAAVVERARYAPAPASAYTVRADVTLVHRALARSASQGVRWRARLLPASTLQPLRANFRQAAGLLTGWMPVAGEG